MKQQPPVGTPILYFQSGNAFPFTGVVAGDAGDGRVNIAYHDSQGKAGDRQGVPVVDQADAAGDYVLVGADAKAAIQAHAKAMRKAGHSIPKADQPPGSGGPFDPANTAAGQMSESAKNESASVGQPTTGGMTPKTGPGSPAEAVNQAQPSRGSGAIPFATHNEEVDRDTRNQARHKEAVAKSDEITKARGTKRPEPEPEPEQEQEPAPKQAAKKAPAAAAAPARKAPLAKKIARAAKPAAKKKSRR